MIFEEDNQLLQSFFSDTLNSCTTSGPAEMSTGTVSPSASTSSLDDLSSATSADLPPSPTKQEAELPDEIKQQKAISLKDEGNKLFVAGEYDKAKLKYGEGIAFDPRIVQLWSNRAACELKLEQHGLAIEDASQ
jgi:serine/threonine-protein phosphatase 5